MTVHPETELLSAYLDRELVERETRRVEGHLSECLRCQQRLDGLREVVAKLHRVESVPIPRLLYSQIPHRISLESRPQGLMDRFENRLRRFYFPQSSIPLTFALVIALVVVVYFFVWGADRVCQRSQTTTYPAEVLSPGDVVSPGEVPRTQSEVERGLEIDRADR